MRGGEGDISRYEVKRDRQAWGILEARFLCKVPLGEVIEVGSRSKAGGARLRTLTTEYRVTCEVCGFLGETECVHMATQIAAEHQVGTGHGVRITFPVEGWGTLGILKG